MDLELVGTVWEELKRYINKVDREEAAENFVNVLVDHDCDPEDIRAAFKSDTDIKRALASYLEDNTEDDDEFDEEDNYDDDNY